MGSYYWELLFNKDSWLVLIILGILVLLNKVVPLEEEFKIIWIDEAVLIYVDEVAKVVKVLRVLEGAFERASHELIEFP